MKQAGLPWPVGGRSSIPSEHNTRDNGHREFMQNLDTQRDPGSRAQVQGIGNREAGG
ncbi:hypothetical protein ANO14919_003310 [Xylariales sp. No.14919]|nr:hypothetical protein ANO14919_003310 [Xylariales sp. No.14919]